MYNSGSVVVGCPSCGDEGCAGQGELITLLQPSLHDDWDYLGLAIREMIGAGARLSGDFLNWFSDEGVSESSHGALVILYYEAMRSLPKGILAHEGGDLFTLVRVTVPCSFPGGVQSQG